MYFEFENSGTMNQREGLPVKETSRVNAPRPAETMDLALIGNCTTSALVERSGSIVWCCMPRFDSTPVFDALLHSDKGLPLDGAMTVELENLARAEQSYDAGTAIVRTQLWDDLGQGIELVDFAPRFVTRDRVFRPAQLVRRVRPLAGHPRVRFTVRPHGDWGATPPTLTRGSHHLRFVMPELTLRLNTSVPLTYLVDGTWFSLHGQVSLLLGSDETLAAGIDDTAREFEEQTALYWRHWSRRLAVPLEWQGAVIRAAITFKLCQFEETGAIVAAMTTSIPEAPHSGLERSLPESVIVHAAGYCGMRVGNQAQKHFQHDVYGSIVLGAAQAFHDHRLLRRGGAADFAALEVMGEQAWALHDQPDAGIWESRTRARVHISSALLCWAACDRLGRIATVLNLPERTRLWHERANTIRAAIEQHAWNEERQAYAESLGGRDLDASVLLMDDVGFLPPQDPRFISTVQAMEASLCDGPYLRRYEAADEFGRPETAFNVCSFWRVDALARNGRKDKARAMFEELPSRRSHVGLLSEDLAPATGELWGNFPQTYSMLGIINGAVRLSAPWESAV